MYVPVLSEEELNELRLSFETVTFFVESNKKIADFLDFQKTFVYSCKTAMPNVRRLLSIASSYHRYKTALFLHRTRNLF